MPTGHVKAQIVIFSKSDTFGKSRLSDQGCVSPRGGLGRQPPLQVDQIYAPPGKASSAWGWSNEILTLNGLTHEFQRQPKGYIGKGYIGIIESLIFDKKVSFGFK